MLNNHPEYEAYCIFDADNIVHPKFLRRMNDALCSGFRVAQCNRDTKIHQIVGYQVAIHYFILYKTSSLMKQE